MSLHVRKWRFVQVSRQLVELARKYCKEESSILPTQNFDTLETREERPWDCLDTVEFVLDVSLSTRRCIIRQTTCST